MSTNGRQLRDDPKTVLHHFEMRFKNAKYTSGAEKPVHLSMLSACIIAAQTIRRDLREQYNLGLNLQKDALWIPVEASV